MSQDVPVRDVLPMLAERTFVPWEPCSKSHGEIVPGYASLL